MTSGTKIKTIATFLALTTAIISGTNNFLAKIAATTLGSPIAYTTLKNSVVALLLLGLIIICGRWREIARLNRRQKLILLAIGVIGGSIPFALFFTGLTMTSALNAAFIHKTLFIWVAILAIPLLKEKISRWQWLGIIAIFAANLLLGGFRGFEFNLGELMILGATILWAIENIIAKKALAELSMLTVVGARLIIGSILLISYLVLTKSLPNPATLSSVQWGWTLLTSLLLLGYVLTWYAALKRAPATYVATLLVPATLVTNALTAIFLTHTFTWLQSLSVALFVVGLILMIRFALSAPAKLLTTEQTLNHSHGRTASLH
ncbi:DMT family transporter [Patescibacteria group bacterium]|nr:DMT family transporter [Patescibacteria group bacterium]MBU1916180.1 DMT family transporter [Patescibacteria group bacterium]